MESIIDLLVFIQNSPLALLLITVTITIFLIFKIIKGECNEPSEHE